MNPVELIQKKRDGGRLSDAEIRFFIDQFVAGTIPDYQMAAMAMAIFFRGMTPRETAILTDGMLRSGPTLAWPGSKTYKVDKHSTGGVGDKVSLILAPMLACVGLRVPMISGRGLGATGGTLDKMAAIPGFRTDLSVPEIQRLTEKVGCVITGQTAELVPADRKLYALRDVTATVPSIPLITASILSKKLAEGLDALVLDVKWGSGAFMKTLDTARALATSLCNTAREQGLKTTALLTDMNQPLGKMAGHSLEVMESIEALAGHFASDLMEVTLALGAELLVSTTLAPTLEEATRKLRATITSGQALEKFREMVRAQSGDPDAQLPIASRSTISADRSGYLSALDCESLGAAITTLGGGRQKVTDTIDPSVGLETLTRLGDPVERGQPLFNVFAKEKGREEAIAKIRLAITITDEPPPPTTLIVERFASG